MNVLQASKKEEIKLFSTGDDVVAKYKNGLYYKGTVSERTSKYVCMYVCMYVCTPTNAFQTLDMRGSFR